LKEFLPNQLHEIQALILTKKELNLSPRYLLQQLKHFVQ
jgi:hypothetical protein